MANTTADKLTYLEETKAAIKDAIVSKEVAIPDGTTFRQYAGKIGEIAKGLQFVDSLEQLIKAAQGGRQCFIYLMAGGKPRVVIDFSGLVTYVNTRVTYKSSLDYVILCGLQVGCLYIGYATKGSNDITWIVQHIFDSGTEPELLISGYALKYAIG